MGKYRRHSLEEAQQIARQMGGECLSESYANDKVKMLWRCSEGHEWETSLYVINRGHWCPVCNLPYMSKEDSFKEIADICQHKGGKLLSEHYESSTTKMRFRCACGNEWETTPHKIKQGNWCPVCGEKKRAASRRLSLSDMQELAASFGGECLSTEYVNMKIKMKWRCSEGHEWEAIPSSIRQGSWCPKCGVKSMIETKSRKSIESR